MSALRGDRLKNLRENFKESQTDTAAVIGVAQSTYALFESGKREPNLDVLVAIAEHFHVTSDFLLDLSSSSKPENANITDTTGLSEKSVEILKGCLKLDKQNSITLTINTLLENRIVIGKIRKYLYYKLTKEQLDGTHEKPMVPYVLKYKYKDDSTAWKVGGANAPCPVDADSSVEVLTEENCRKLLLFEVEEELIKLLEQENKITHF